MQGGRKGALEQRPTGRAPIETQTGVRRKQAVPAAEGEAPDPLPEGEGEAPDLLPEGEAGQRRSAQAADAAGSVKYKKDSLSTSIKGVLFCAYQ